MQWLWRIAAPEAEGLLRVLFLWLGAESADSSGTFKRAWRGLLLCGVTLMGDHAPCVEDEPG